MQTRTRWLPVDARETNDFSANHSPAAAHDTLWLAPHAERGDAGGARARGLAVKHDTGKKSAALSFGEAFHSARGKYP